MSCKYSRTYDSARRNNSFGVENKCGGDGGGGGGYCCCLFPLAL